MLKEHKPIFDANVNDTLMSSLVEVRNLELESWSTDHHIEVFKSWISNSQKRKLIGIQDFENIALCSGTSQAIENFINRNQSRRLRFSNAEFVLAKICCNANSIGWKFLEDGQLESNDAVVLSFPFSGNGGIYPGFGDLIERCTDFQVPVLIDSAYFGICTDLDIDLGAPCITDVTLSLSKPFSTMLRHGIRFTRMKYDDLIQTNSDLGILARPCVALSSLLMSKFDADYVVNKYLNRYRDICDRQQLMTTPTITLALGDQKKHAEFSRSGYVRVCVTDELLA